MAIEVNGNKTDAQLNANRSGAVTLREQEMTTVTWRESMPRWAVPVLGGTVFLGLIGVWLTSSLWLFTS